MGDPFTKMVLVDGSPNPYEKFEIVAHFLKLELRKILTRKQACLPTYKISLDLNFPKMILDLKIDPF